MFKLLVDTVKDHVSGNKAKANARLGLVRPPEGSGKLIWLVADDSYDSVLMAAALLSAIREKRQDVRLVLTYQAEYKDIIVHHMSGAKKIGFGYGCGDSVFAARQMLKRLSPFAIVFAGHQPKKSMLEALENTPAIHKIAFQFKPTVRPGNTGKKVSENNDKDGAEVYEACYPDTVSNHLLDMTVSKHTSTPFNVLTRLVQSQVDRQLGALLCGDCFNTLFHVHNPDKKSLSNILSGWKNTPISDGNILVLSFSNRSLHNSPSNSEPSLIINACKSIVSEAGYSPVLLSQWNQSPVVKGSVIIVDEEKWYAAICASSAATHLFSTNAFHFWQAVSSGSIISCDTEYNEMAVSFNTIVGEAAHFEDVLQEWVRIENNPVVQRNKSDAIRKLFWAERREAETQTDALLQRVYNW